MKLTEEWLQLLDEAQDLARIDIPAEQIIAVHTSKHNVYSLANHDITVGNVSDEENFAKMLAENDDTEILNLVCMWRDGMVDLPSFHLRNLLICLNSQNLQTKLLLRGSSGYNVKEMKITMPPD